MASTATPRASLGNLVRLTPLTLNELPAHASIPNSPDKSSATTDGERPRPDLLAFLRAILDEGGAFLSKQNFPSTFSRHSTKSPADAKADVDVLTRDISASEIKQLDWGGGPIPRRKARAMDAEHWFARRSRHANKSSKEEQGSASWDEFVFGLRDQHSQHEFDFTPTVYDAHRVLDWNEQVHALASEGRLGHYSHATMSIYEMCHAIPAPLQPRCFPVLVCTASTTPTSFLAVTIPVDLSALQSSFYLSGRNLTSGADSQQRKKTVRGAYAAIETCYIDESDGMVDWTMATASDTRGNLPMCVQKMGVPGAIVKDVGFFMKWIPTVNNREQGEAQGPGTSTAR